MRNGATEACIFRVCNYSFRYNFLNFCSLLAVSVLLFGFCSLLFMYCCLLFAVCRWLFAALLFPVIACVIVFACA